MNNIMNELTGNPETRAMCRIVLRNILYMEFTERLKEIEQARRGKT